MVSVVVYDGVSSLRWSSAQVPAVCPSSCLASTRSGSTRRHLAFASTRSHLAFAYAPLTSQALTYGGEMKQPEMACMWQDETADLELLLHPLPPLPTHHESHNHTSPPASLLSAHCAPAGGKDRVVQGQVMASVEHVLDVFLALCLPPHLAPEGAMQDDNTVADHTCRCLAIEVLQHVVLQHVVLQPVIMTCHGTCVCLSSVLHVWLSTVLHLCCYQVCCIYAALPWASHGGTSRDRV